MTITIQTLLDRGYVEPRRPYRWTGLGQQMCPIWMTPEQYIALMTIGRIRHCVSCYRSMMYKPAGEQDPDRSWRVVCRGCYAAGKRLDREQESH